MIAILSLIVAGLAVFTSPFVSWVIAKRQFQSFQRQLQSSLEIANKQITAPMRQAWINKLRDIVAELSSSALHYYVAGFNERADKEYQQLSLLEHKIQLMLNAAEDDHKRLEAVIREMLQALERRYREKDDQKFIAAYEEVLRLSRQVFKREWNRVKERINVL